MGLKLFSRNEILSLMGEAEVFDAILKREIRGSYDTLSGSYTTQKVGFNCRLLPLNKPPSEGDNPIINELKGSTKEVLTAISKNKIIYDNNWIQVGSLIEEPFVPDKNDFIEYNGVLYTIEAVNSQDFETNVLYLMILSK